MIKQRIGKEERSSGFNFNGESDSRFSIRQRSGVTADASSVSRKLLPHQGARVEHALYFILFDRTCNLFCWVATGLKSCKGGVESVCCWA
ncbi:hypothetical protein BRARA_D00266 [Brassica rapa]|uniref:Uncharacterized protein n=1 Tax=Brassica campestris TaxID=3711 RepID=A0A397ZQZ0_BRACM|nr:hypothetical protein BRARA_D00266 [Brassica rapa]